MKTFIMIISVFAVISLSACSNTWQGMGRDMEQTGQKMQKQF